MTTHKLSPQQAFLIYSMLFGTTQDEREPLWSDTKIKSPQLLRNLIDDGLVKAEPRAGRRGRFLTLTPKGKQWALENLGTAELMKTARASALLQRVLYLLRDVVGGDIGMLLRLTSGIGSRATITDPPVRVSAATTDTAATGIEDRIRAAYFSLTNGASKQRVLLKDLRARVNAPRPELDQTLLAMQKEQKLVLMKLDNPSEVTADDDAAALHIAGNPRHLLLFQA